MCPLVRKHIYGRIWKTIYLSTHKEQINDVSAIYRRYICYPPVLAFKRNVNLKQLIGSNVIENNKVMRKSKTNKIGKCQPCFSSTKNLCCNHVCNTTTFKSNQTNRIFKLFHRLNCRSKYLIYLLECIKCKKQYVGKAETPFNIRLNNHRKDVSKPNAIPACKHFAQNNHIFKEHARFTLIEQLNYTNISKETITSRLKERENFWIQTLKTLHPFGLNQELN